MASKLLNLLAPKIKILVAGLAVLTAAGNIIAEDQRPLAFKPAPKRNANLKKSHLSQFFQAAHLAYDLQHARFPKSIDYYGLDDKTAEKKRQLAMGESDDYWISMTCLLHRGPDPGGIGWPSTCGWNSKHFQHPGKFENLGWYLFGGGYYSNIATIEIDPTATKLDIGFSC